jgi:phosphinothricin acetyltransferase
MQPEIRTVQPGDAYAIAEIYRPIVETTTISFEEVAPGEREIAQRIVHVTQGYPWLVAEGDGRLAGYAYASRHRERAAYRYSVDVSVYVAAGARRSGIASKLYAALFADLEQRGFHRAFAGVALPNDASIALHERFGFEPVGVYREVGWKFGRWLDVAWWQKAL